MKTDSTVENYTAKYLSFEWSHHKIFRRQA